MTLEIPERVVMSDGATVDVKGVAALVVDGRLDQVVYTIERSSGAWANVAGCDVRPAAAGAAAASVPA